ncbi:MAG: hypothetical protein HY235_17565 [Acidobacteria bacterium]|nr:hypothetical protein [Acidobacteriota bacterium]
MTAKRISLSLAISGLFLLVPGAYHSLSIKLTGNDSSAALSKLARISLEHLAAERTATMSATIPDSGQWERIRRDWGDPGYLVAAVDLKGKTAFCFDTLGLQVDVIHKGNLVPVETASEPPYGYSAACRIIGVSFRVKPSADVFIRASVPAQRPMPPGELVLLAYWGAATKDRIASIRQEERREHVFGVLATIGFALIVCAAWAAIRARQDQGSANATT